MNVNDVTYIIGSRVLPAGRDDAIVQVAIDKNVILVRTLENNVFEDFYFVCHTAPFSEETSRSLPDALPSLPQVDRASAASEDDDENAHATGPQPLEDAPRTSESGPPGRIRR